MSLCNLCSFFSYFNWWRATLIVSEVSLHVVMTSFVQLTRTFPESIKMLTESLFSISHPPPINRLGPTMTQRIKKANSSWESAWNLNVEIIKKIFGELTWLAESQRNHERTEKQQQKTNSSRPYSFHLKPATTTTTKSERQKQRNRTEKTVTQTLNRCEYLPFLGPRCYFKWAVLVNSSKPSYSYCLYLLCPILL